MQEIQDVQPYTYFLHRDHTHTCQHINKMQEIKEDCDFYHGKVIRKMLWNFKERAADCFLQSTNINKDLPDDRQCAQALDFMDKM